MVPVLALSCPGPRNPGRVNYQGGDLRVGGSLKVWSGREGRRPLGGTWHAQRCKARAKARGTACKGREGGPGESTGEAEEAGAMRGSGARQQQVWMLP